MSPPAPPEPIDPPDPATDEEPPPVPAALDDAELEVDPPPELEEDDDVVEEVEDGFESVSSLQLIIVNDITAIVANNILRINISFFKNRILLYKSS
jgi:hypothetical protein